MNGELAIRRERVAAPVARSVRLLYASDLHLGWPWTRSVAREVLDAVHATRPHALLLGGDLCDGTHALAALVELVRAASASTRVLAVPGNHDLRLGNGLVREALLSAGGAWLVDGEERVEAVLIDGRARPSRPSHGPQSAAPRVLCAHHPRIVEVARRARFDVVLAGHLHGGQLVLFERGGRLYPYAWIDRWCGPRFDLEGTTLLVSRGAGDSLPLRFRCPREVVLCELAPAST